MRPFMLRLTLALSVLLPGAVSAQQARQMTRSTTATTLGDSSVIIVSDTLTSKTTFITKSASLAGLRKAYSKGAFDSLRTTTLNLTGGTVSGAPTFSGKPRFSAAWASTGRDSLLAGSALAFAANDTVYGTPVWNAIQVFATGQLVDSSTGAARSQVLTTARTLWSQSFDGSGNISGSLTGVGNVTGGASSMTVTAGTGNSRQLALQTTTSGGTATTAIRFNELQQSLHVNGSAAQPSITYAGDSTAGQYRFGIDTLGWATLGAQSMRLSGGASAVLAFGAGSSTIIGGTGASRTLTLQSTNASSAILNTLVLGADSSVTAVGRFVGPVATATLPTFSFTGATGDGIYKVAGGDTVAFAINGVRGLSVLGGATAKLIGGAGDMTVQSGTGASRVMNLQTTNASSAAVNTLVLGADSSVTPLGKFVPNSTKGIVGTTTNDNANALSVGEYVSGSRATGSSLSLSTGATLTVDSISLTAGDWDVSGVVAFTFGATTSVTNLTGGISGTTNVIGALGTAFDWETAANIPTAGADAVWTTPTVRISQSGTAFVYLVAQGTFTASTLKGYGAMRARRVR